MIQAWFNERGYRVVADRGISRLVYEFPDDVINNAASLYICRWMVLNEVLDVIHELSETIEDRDIVLYTDSRLIEELKGELTPNNEYAKSSLQHFIECDYVKFRQVDFKKCAATLIYSKLSEQVDAKRHPTA